MEMPRGSSLAGRPSPLVSLRMPGSAVRGGSGRRGRAAALGGGPKSRGAHRPLFSGRRHGLVSSLVRVAPIAAGAAALVLVIVVVSSIVAPHPAKARGGAAGIGGTPLYGVTATAYAPDLLFPAQIAPEDTSLPVIGGSSGAVSASTAAALDQLAHATQAIEDAGFEVGYALLDVSTGVTVSYNADAAFYSASSIKGPYVTSLVEYDLGASVTSEATRISAILQYSDNDAYTSLRKTYGTSTFAQMAQVSGAESLPSYGATETIEAEAQKQRAGGLSDDWYEFYTPNQLLALWKQSYDFLTSGADGADWLARAFSSPETSAIHEAAGGLGTTWSKAGWYPGSDSAYGTTVDAGVIRTNSGDVVVALMTNAPEDFAKLESLVAPLLSVRGAAAPTA